MGYFGRMGWRDSMRLVAVLIAAFLLAACEMPGAECGDDDGMVRGPVACSQSSHCPDGFYCVSLEEGSPTCAASCGPYTCSEDEACVTLTDGHDACIPRGNWACGEWTCNGVFCVYVCRA